MDAPATVRPAERALSVRVLWTTALAAVIAWAVLITGVVILESLGRDRVASFVAQRVASILDLKPSNRVHVDIGGSLLVFQALGQRLDSVEVTAVDVALGELVGDVRFTATGVPLDTSLPFDRVVAEVRVDEEVVSSLASGMTNAAVSSVEIAEPLVTLGTTVTIPSIVIFGVTLSPGFDLAVGVGLEPFVSDGRIAFTPVSFAVNDTELSAEAFADLYREAALALTRFGAICVADTLPAALRLESVEVRGDELVIGLGATNAVFSNESLAVRGECV